MKLNEPEFDQFTPEYDRFLSKSLVATGETREYFAQRRIDWTMKCSFQLGVTSRRILDFGCGDGSSAILLAAKFQAERVIGVDVSSVSIVNARNSNGSDVVSFLTTDDWTPDGTMDLAYVNGVFHHIDPPNRQEFLLAIRRALRPKGIFALWENNPWNPGTRYVMSQCEFDANAMPITPPQARAMLSKAGFKVLQTDFLFFFPRSLRALRGTEDWLRRIPLGGQYQVLCRG